MPIAFEIQQGLPCVFTNLPNLLYIRIATIILVTVSDSLMEWCSVPLSRSGGSVTIAKRAHVCVKHV